MNLPTTITYRKEDYTFDRGWGLYLCNKSKELHFEKSDINIGLLNYYPPNCHYLPNKKDFVTQPSFKANFDYILTYINLMVEPEGKMKFSIKIGSQFTQQYVTPDNGHFTVVPSIRLDKGRDIVIHVSVIDVFKNIENVMALITIAKRLDSSIVENLLERQRKPARAKRLLG